MDVFTLRTIKNEFSTQFQITIVNQTEIKWPASCVVLLVFAFFAHVAELLVGLFGDRHLVALLAVLDVGNGPAASATILHVAFDVCQSIAHVLCLALGCTFHIGRLGGPARAPCRTTTT